MASTKALSALVLSRILPPVHRVTVALHVVALRAAAVSDLGVATCSLFSFLFPHRQGPTAPGQSLGLGCVPPQGSVKMPDLR